MGKPRTPGDIPNSFVYRTYETVLDKLLGRAGIVRDFHGLFEDTAPHIVKEAETSWGLHPLGYEYAYHSAGTNWYLPEASAFINIWSAGRNRGSVTVMMDDESNDNHNLGMYFRLLDGTQVSRRDLRSDIPGCAVAYLTYNNKAEFLDALRKADVLVRDNATNESFYALTYLNSTLTKSGRYE